MKQVLVGPIRRYLTHITTSGNNQPHQVQYFTRMRKLDLANPTRPLLDQNKMNQRDFSCRQTRAQLLLDQDHLFWKVFDEVIRMPKISYLLKHAQKVVTLTTVRDFSSFLFFNHVTLHYHYFLYVCENLLLRSMLEFRLDRLILYYYIHGNVYLRL